VKGKAALLAYFKKLLLITRVDLDHVEGIPMEDGFLNKWRATIPVGPATMEIVGVCFVQLNEAGKIRRNEVYFDRAQLLAEITGRKNPLPHKGTLASWRTSLPHPIFDFTAACAF